MTALKTASAAGARATSPATGPASAQTPSSIRLMAVLTTADPETQFMALTLLKSSGVDPRQIRILLCGPSGDLGLKLPAEASPSTFGPASRTAQALLAELDEQGATIEVCAIYLPARRSDRSILMDSIGVASPIDIGPILADPAVRVLTF
jgi:hypothetical protein